MLGAPLMMCISYTIGTINPQWRIFSFERAIFAIDMNVIFLFTGIMIIGGILENRRVSVVCLHFLQTGQGENLPAEGLLDDLYRGERS